MYLLGYFLTWNSISGGFDKVFNCPTEFLDK